MTHIQGLVVPGRGLGATRLADVGVLERIEQLFRPRIVPGTLNVRLTAPFDRTLASRYVATSELDPGWEASTGQAGYRLVPALVAGLIPWSITKWRAGDAYLWPVRAVGVALIVAGGLVLPSAFARFVTEGRGTPAPVAPTQRLVIGEMYRYVRNPRLRPWAPR